MGGMNERARADNQDDFLLLLLLYDGMIRTKLMYQVPLFLWHLFQIFVWHETTETTQKNR